MNSIAYRYHESPVGPLLLAASALGLRALYMHEQRHGPGQPPPLWIAASPEQTREWLILERTSRQLDEYFDGRRTGFDVPLDLDGTFFQRSVWRGLCGIGYAETISYGELARRIGNAKAVRAVGLANGRNPVSIVVPCHRVIGADGTLTGYGGGVERKAFLLALEARTAGARASGQLALV